MEIAFSPLIVDGVSNRLRDVSGRRTKRANPSVTGAVLADRSGLAVVGNIASDGFEKGFGPRKSLKGYRGVSFDRQGTAGLELA